MHAESIVEFRLTWDLALTQSKLWSDQGRSILHRPGSTQVVILAV